ncbi:hypothetical protein D3C83_90170 [compost metagenome]
MRPQTCAGGGKFVTTCLLLLTLADRLRFTAQADCFDRGEIEQRPVQQMRWSDVLDAGKNALDAPGVALLPLAQQRLELLALQVFLRAA